MVAFGVMIPQGWFAELPAETYAPEQYEAMVALAREVERLGYASGWLFDHFRPHPMIPPERVPTTSTFECWTTLAALARETARLRLGSLVSAVAYRSPALLAKMAACVDVLSGGRLEFGIGAGGFEGEHVSYGFPFAPPRTRVAQLNEAIQIIRAMWREEKASFRGNHFVVEEAPCVPKPIQRPGPPLTVGAGSGRRLPILRLAARWADRCTLLRCPPDECARQLDMLRGHAEEVERDYDTIEKSVHLGLLLGRTTKEVERRLRVHKPPNVSLKAFRAEQEPGTVIGTPEEVATRLLEYRNLGVTYFIFQVDGALERDPLRLFADEVTPQLAG
ncbi:MAG: TIGR03560 family F420-dependent LLM class oxidoreductase [Thermoplasmata archaeon]